MMNVALTDSAAPVPKRGHLIVDPDKRLVSWGSPIAVKDLDPIQKRHDELRNMHALHSALRMASWFHTSEREPVTVGKNVGHALYFYNLPCQARLAIWVPKLEDTAGKLAVYMTGYVGRQDLAEIQCNHVLVEVKRALGA